MRRNYLITFASEFIVIGAGFLVYWVAARYWSAQAFGEYMLARRTLSLLHLPCALGLGLSVPRFVALATARPDEAPRPFLLAGVALAAIPLASLGVLFALAPGWWATLFFSAASYASLLPGLYLATVGLILHVLVYGYLRGHLRMAGANAVQLIVYGIIPLGTFLVPGLTVGAALMVLGVSWIIVAGTCALLIAAGELRRNAGRPLALRTAARELLAYGIPRLPGDVALSALYTLPATLTAHWASVEAAGHVAFGISALNLAAGVFSPVGLVLMPTATAMQASGRLVELRRSVWRLVMVGGLLAVGATVVLEFVAPLLVSWYLGPAFAAAALVLRLVGLALAPQVVYLVLRDPIDAVSVKAHNGWNVVASLGIFLVGAMISQTVLGISISLAVAILVLGIMSVRSARLLLGRP